MNALRTATALLAGFTLTLAACGGGDDESAASDTDTAAAEAEAETAPSETAADAPAAGSAEITISGFAFSGASEVAAGTTLTIVNNDSAPHTFTAQDGSFDTGTIDPGASATITLDTAGTFSYKCNFHGSMTGTITVTG